MQSRRAHDYDCAGRKWSTPTGAKYPAGVDGYECARNAAFSWGEHAGGNVGATRQRGAAGRRGGPQRGGRSTRPDEGRHHRQRQTI